MKYLHSRILLTKKILLQKKLNTTSHFFLIFFIDLFKDYLLKIKNIKFIYTKRDLHPYYFDMVKKVIK
jgi:hypothetical protein